jgi:hypothetical protein
MRRYAAVLIVVMAVCAPCAHAGVRADYAQSFTTPVPGAPTGSDTQILYKHPSDPARKPIPVRREVFTFPSGTTYDEGVVPDCTASDLQLMVFGPPACPESSWMGGGQGDTSMAGFDDTEQAVDVNGWDDAGVLVLLGGSHDIQPLRFVTRIHREGRVVTVDVPRTPGGPPDGESALRRVHNVFAARTLGDRAYMRTPPTCPRSGAWTFKAEFTFADGAVEHAEHRMPCAASG